MEIFEQRSGSGLADHSSLIGGSAADLDLDPEQGLDPHQRLACSGRVNRDIEVIERPADVGPAGHFLHTTGLIEPVEPGVTVRLQHSVIVLQMRQRPFALAIQRVPEPDRRRRRICARSVALSVGPQPSGLGLAVAGGQHRDGGVVGVDLGRRADVLTDRIGKWRQEGHAAAHHPGKRRTIQINAIAGIDPALAIQRQVVAVLEALPDSERWG